MSENDILGLNAYAFEPEYSETEIQNIQENNEESTPDVNRVQVPVSEWCSCDNCQTMAKSEECICCAACDYVIPNMEDKTCIIEHPSFDLIVCNRDVLAVAYIQIMIYKRLKGRAPDQLSNK